MVCTIPGEVKEGERRHHIMANHGDIQPISSVLALPLPLIGRKFAYELVAIFFKCKNFGHYPVVLFLFGALRIFTFTLVSTKDSMLTPFLKLGNTNTDICQNYIPISPGSVETQVV